MDKNIGENFLEAIKEMQASRGHEIDSKDNELENSFIVMVINFGELKQFIENVPVFSVEQRHKGEVRKYLLNALRLFSNYLTSCTAFVDHTRRFMRDIYGSTDKAFDGKYDEKIEDCFKGDEYVKFFEDLRHFSQHYKPLPIGILTEVKEEGLYSRVVIFKNSLLEGSYAWEKGKQFIDQMGDHCDILYLSEKYLNKTIFPWIMQQQSKYHSKEFDEFKKLKEIAKNLYFKNKK